MQILHPFRQELQTENLKVKHKTTTRLKIHTQTHEIIYGKNVLYKLLIYKKNTLKTSGVYVIGKVVNIFLNLSII